MEPQETYEVVLETPGLELVAELTRVSGLSRSRIKQAMSCGAVWLQHGKKARRIRRADAAYEAGDQVLLNYSPEVLDAVPPLPTLLDQQDKFSVWYKPPGLMSSGSRFGDHFAIDRQIEKQLGFGCYLVHRLDRAASGVMVVAHNKRTATALAAQFESQQVTKQYWVEVMGHPPPAGLIQMPVDGKAATTQYEVLERREQSALLCVTIETGRRHQIRQHLAEQGWPVKGDSLYGNAAAEDLMHLIAWHLCINHPGTDAPLDYRLTDELVAADSPWLSRAESSE